MSTHFMQWLASASLATSLASIAVLLLRRPMRAWAGASIAYLLWACVPLALLATLLPRGSAPAVVAVMDWQAAVAAPVQQAREVLPGWSGWLLPLWAAGALAWALLMGWQQWRFRRGLGGLRRRGDGTWQAARPSPALPAVAGLLRPRILLPGDFEARYSAQEQVVVLEHERQHLCRGDLQANAVAALLRCLFWFNPLLAIAWRCFRHDQELACDAAVLARHPQHRRDYGQAMLKAHMAALVSPLGCHWQVRHPLRERIELLARPLPSRLRARAAAGLVAFLALGGGYAAWAMQPPAAAAPAQAALAGRQARDPVALEAAPPRYPEEAARAHINGEVVLLLDVDATGAVTAVEVERAQPAGVFEEASLAAARQWRFRPAMLDGQPAAARLRLPISFRSDLDEGEEGGQ